MEQMRWFKQIFVKLLKKVKIFNTFIRRAIRTMLKKHETKSNYALKSKDHYQVILSKRNWKISSFFVTSDVFCCQKVWEESVPQHVDGTILRRGAWWCPAKRTLVAVQLFFGHLQNEGPLLSSWKRGCIDKLPSVEHN